MPNETLPPPVEVRRGTRAERQARLSLLRRSAGRPASEARGWRTWLGWAVLLVGVGALLTVLLSQRWQAGAPMPRLLADLGRAAWRTFSSPPLLLLAGSVLAYSVVRRLSIALLWRAQQRRSALRLHADADGLRAEATGAQARVAWADVLRQVAGPGWLAVEAGELGGVLVIEADRVPSEAYVAWQDLLAEKVAPVARQADAEPEPAAFEVLPVADDGPAEGTGRG